MRKLIIFVIEVYQKTISPDHGVFGKTKTCVFYPTCSEYTKKAVKKYGAVKGVWMGIRRVLRCHPWQKEHIDDIT